MTCTSAQLGLAGYNGREQDCYLSSLFPDLRRQQVLPRVLQTGRRLHLVVARQVQL